MTLYECRGSPSDMEVVARFSGGVCYLPGQPTLQCNTIAATWSLGSEVSVIKNKTIIAKFLLRDEKETKKENVFMGFFFLLDACIYCKDSHLVRIMTSRMIGQCFAVCHET